MILHGVRYSTQVVIRLRTPQQWSVDDPSTYCCINAILVYQEHKVFVLKALSVVTFVEHWKAFEVVPTNQVILATFHDFYRHSVLHFKQKRDKNYIIEKDHVDISL